MNSPDLLALTGRTLRPLPATGWRHLTGDAPGAEAPEFDDQAWPLVSVPHTWNVRDAVRCGDPDGRNMTGYYRGPGWYRQTLRLGGPFEDRRFFLRFEGVSQTAEVFLNGHRLGAHAGAFTAFCLEATPQVVPGPNHLAVRVTNAWDPTLAPLEGDFAVFGGLYRPVRLLTTAGLCVSPLPHGGPGIHVLPLAVSAARAVCSVRVALDDARRLPAPFTVRVTIADAAGRVLARSVADVPPGQTESVHELAVAHPRRWDGVRDPYLHQVRAELVRDGMVVDAVAVPFGFRSFAFAPTGEFLLNGRPCRLAGVNRHQDREGKGWAVADADHEQDLALIRELGANAVRLAHYPHADRFYELCDRAGLLVWAEIPLVNVIDDSPAFAATTCRQLEELIHQQFNRAGIFAWGIWNELGMTAGPDPGPLVRQLHALARRLDPSRPTVAAAFGLTHRRHPALLGITDQLGWNEYPGWYGAGPPAQLGATLDRLRTRVPGKGLAISEYGAGASIHHHAQDLTGAPAPHGRWHPEEWQAFVHEETWREIARRPFVWGSFVWNLCDFASAMRAEGDRDGINDKGLVTFDRRIRKDAFFFYQATWSDTPVLYLTSRRHAVRHGALTAVKVYTNADEVHLLLNGAPMPPPEVDGVIRRWPGIRLRPGDNQLEVFGRHAGRSLRDACVWTLTDAPEEATGGASALPH